MAVVSALDSYTPKNIGYNGHLEYSWSHDYKEQLFQLFNQLVRTKDTTKLEKMLNGLLSAFKKSISKDRHHLETICLLSLLYKLIGQTRDIVNGKGEYALTHMQIWVWYQHFPQLAMYAFEKCVKMSDDTDDIYRNDFSLHPYGSWKDVKYFCDYVKTRSGSKDHPLIEFAITLLVKQLSVDKALYDEDKPISLAAKWCPREKSHFSWMYSKIVKKVVPIYFMKCETKKQYDTAMRKGKMYVRKNVLSPLNKALKTTQIAQCAKKWASLDFSEVTSITMRKQTLGFQNKTKKGEVRSEEDDRIKCAKNFTEHIAAAKSGDGTAKVHGKRVSVYEMVKDAIASTGNAERRDVINLQWEDNKSQNAGLGNFIAMADTSGSMTCDNSVPLYNSIGLSIRVSELTRREFRNRVMTFSAVPEWVKMDELDTFTDKVYKISKCNWGMNTNFYAALQMILDVIVSSAMRPNDVENMVLVIFSDMQIDSASDENMDTMYDTIEKKYAQAGIMSMYKTPYKPPHILFWNLSSTNGFPVLSSQKNVTTLSGYSPILLNVFKEKGIEGLKEFTPFKLMTDLLKHDRYECLENMLLRKCT